MADNFIEINDDEDIELSTAQIERVDEIHNAVYDLCKIMCEEPDLGWDMAYIGEIADLATDVLVGYGKRIRYPYMTMDNDGTQHIEDYVS